MSDDTAGNAGDTGSGRIPAGRILFMTGLHIVNQIDRQLVAAFAAVIEALKAPR